MEIWDNWKANFFVEQLEFYKFLTETAEECESPIERIAYVSLMKLCVSYGAFNYKIIPQSEILNYRVDFLVIYGDKYIVVECDGHEWHEKTKEQASKDKKRDRELQKAGYIVFRYSGSDINKDPDKICYDIQTVFGHPEWASTGTER